MKCICPTYLHIYVGSDRVRSRDKIILNSSKSVQKDYQQKHAVTTMSWTEIPWFNTGMADTAHKVVTN